MLLQELTMVTTFLHVLLIHWLALSLNFTFDVCDMDQQVGVCRKFMNLGILLQLQVTQQGVKCHADLEGHINPILHAVFHQLKFTIWRNECDDLL